MLNLGELRQQIDALDYELLAILNKRMTVVAEIGKLKKQLHMPPLQPKRWEELLNDRIARGEKYSLSQKLIRTIWESIHDEALEVEEAEGKK